MPTQVKRWGSVAILTTIFTGLAVAVIFNSMTWAVTQINDISPMVKSVDRLSVTIIKNQDINALQHAELALMIYNGEKERTINEVKLNRVISDCRSNHNEIQVCKERLK